MAKNEPGAAPAIGAPAAAPIGAPMVPPSPHAGAVHPPPSPYAGTVAVIGAPMQAPAAPLAVDPFDAPVMGSGFPASERDPREQHIGSQEWWEYMLKQGITYDFGSFRTFGHKTLLGGRGPPLQVCKRVGFWRDYHSPGRVGLL